MWKSRLKEFAKLSALVLSMWCFIYLADVINPKPPYRVVTPTVPSEFIPIDATIYTDDGSGSGTVVRSYPIGSDILTNAHVCIGARKKGASIWIKKKRYIVTQIKPYPDADLCLMRVAENLGLGVQIGRRSPRPGDPIIVAGHPNTLPLIVQYGYASEIQIFKHNKRTRSEEGMVVGVLVQPGSSGSGVYNASGQLVGVIDALSPAHKKSDIGFGIAVPQPYVRTFLQDDASKIPWIKVPRDART